MSVPQGAGGHQNVTLIPCHLGDNCHCGIYAGFPTGTQYQPCSPRMLSQQTQTNSL